MIDIKLDLPDGFLNEEVRCDYVISRKIKEVWAVELDLLAEFDRVCKKYGITYFACSGTALGAVRHGGFIPWDDDADLMMFRDQYNKLCEIAPMEFKSPYFWQTEYTDPGSQKGHAQLRNSGTTGILKGEYRSKYHFNQGIFIDIFPLDAVVEDERLYKKQVKKIKLYRKVSWSLSERNLCALPPIKRGVKKIVIKAGKFIGISSEKYYRKFEKECEKYNHLDTKYIAFMSYSSKEPFRYREDFQKSVLLDFEFMKIPVPVNYRHALDVAYGNWEKFEKGTSDHGEVLFDTDTGYIEYLNKGQQSRTYT